jgi:DinB superfamily
MLAIIDNEMLWRQFEVAIDMLNDALRDCPDELWEKRLWEDQPDQWVAPGFSTFWYLGYHALFWLDLYLTGAEEGFTPPAPFDLVEMEPNEVLPRTYTREELLGYLELCRQKCQETISTLSIDQAHRWCRFAWGELPFAELLLYTLRHVQEHGAQLHMFLGQQAGKSAAWTSRTQE